MKKQERTFPIFQIVLGLFILSGAVLLFLPQLLDSSVKARQSEAKQTLGVLSRGQQANYFENQTFADDFATLALGIDEETDNYRYSIENHSDHVFHFASAKDYVPLVSFFGNRGVPFLDRIPVDRIPNLFRAKNNWHFIGAVFEMKDGEIGTVICELYIQKNNSDFSFSNFLPSLENNVPICHPDTEEL